MIVGVGDEIWQFLAAFYANDRLVQLGDPVRIQALLDTLISLLERVGLRTNVFKTKTVLYILGQIRTCQSQAPYIEQMEGHAEVEIWKNLRVGWDVCGKDLAAPSL